MAFCPAAVVKVAQLGFFSFGSSSCRQMNVSLSLYLQFLIDK
jgi:hypothetical protein